MLTYIVVFLSIYIGLSFILLQMALDESGDGWRFLFDGGKLRGCLVLLVYVALWLPWLIGASAWAFAKAFLTKRR